MSLGRSPTDLPERRLRVTPLGDRLLRVGGAVILGAALFGWRAFADRGSGLDREQQLFIGGVLVYGVTTLYLLLRQRVLHRLHGPVKKAAAVAAAESPIVSFLLLFGSGTVPWPTSLVPYWAGTFVVAPLAVIAVDWLFRRDADRPA